MYIKEMFTNQILVMKENFYQNKFKINEEKSSEMNTLLRCIRNGLGGIEALKMLK
jgi:hypothetical protein